MIIKRITYTHPKMEVTEIKITNIICGSPTEDVVPGGGHQMDLFIG